MTDKIHPHRAGVPPVTKIAKGELQGQGLPKPPQRKAPSKDVADFGRAPTTPVADPGVYTLQDILGPKDKGSASR